MAGSKSHWLIAAGSQATEFASLLPLLMQEHTNTIRRFQFVSLQEAAAYVAKAEKPDQRGQPAPEGVTAQPSLDWPLILDSLELTKQQRKV